MFSRIFPDKLFKDLSDTLNIQNSGKLCVLFILKNQLSIDINRKKNLSRYIRRIVKVHIKKYVTLGA